MSINGTPQCRTRLTEDEEWTCSHDVDERDTAVENESERRDHGETGREDAEVSEPRLTSHPVGAHARDDGEGNENGERDGEQRDDGRCVLRQLVLKRVRCESRQGDVVIRLRSECGKELDLPRFSGLGAYGVGAQVVQQLPDLRLGVATSGFTDPTNCGADEYRDVPSEIDSVDGVRQCLQVDVHVPVEPKEKVLATSPGAKVAVIVRLPRYVNCKLPDVSVELQHVAIDIVCENVPVYLRRRYNYVGEFSQR